MTLNNRLRKLAKRVRTSNLVSVDIDAYSKTIRKILLDLLEYALDKKAKAQNNISKEDIIREISKAYGPQSQYLKEFLKDPSDWNHVAQLYKQVSKDFNTPYDLAKLLRQYLEILDDSFSEEELTEQTHQNIDRLISETKHNITEISKIILEAASRIDDWEAPIIITASVPYNTSEANLVHGADSFHISIRREEVSFFIATENGKLLIDDVLEGGDYDIFRNSLEQQDYFNLIKELRNPGSTNKPGKKKILYTARPVKDRKRYDEAKDIPVNIFLSSDLNDAQGLATDLAGSGVRDLWKVVIDDRHLIQTLDGNVKHFQTIGRGVTVPIYRIELLIPGE